MFTNSTNDILKVVTNYNVKIQRVQTLRTPATNFFRHLSLAFLSYHIYHVGFNMILLAN